MLESSKLVCQVAFRIYMVSDIYLGQAYEKKAKQKQRDVGEEHTRYVALLNSLGPEMQQEK